MPDLTSQRLKELLRYDPENGTFHWLPRASARGFRTSRLRVPAGSLNKSNGRIYIRVDNKRYIASRLAWFYMKGEWPSGEVDHKDTNPTNNRWENLRLASRSQNAANKGLRFDNKTGFKGVRRLKSGRFCACIRVNGREIALGTFDIAEHAHAAYCSASEQYFGEFARAA